MSELQTKLLWVGYIGVVNKCNMDRFLFLTELINLHPFSNN